MKLNADYVRDILLYIEKNLDYQEPTNPNYHNELLFGKLLADNVFDEYNKEELTYALELLIKEKLIECAKEPYFVRGNLMSADIIGLTWKGHELLANVRDNTVWNAVKNKALKYGGLSISALCNGAKFLGNALMENPNAIEDFLQGIDNIKKYF